jgi:UDP-N-acetylmuramoyl-tripeptide--D-alanyl-D-alanine ligase
VGHRAAEVADLLVAVGQRSRWTAEAAVANGLPEDRLHTFATSDEAIAALPGLLLPGDNVLVKGSRGVAADRIVTALQRRAEESD